MSEQDDLRALTGMMDRILHAKNEARLSAESLALAQQEHDAEKKALCQSVADRDDAITRLNDELASEQAVIIGLGKKLKNYEQGYDQLTVEVAMYGHLRLSLGKITGCMHQPDNAAEYPGTDQELIDAVSHLKFRGDMKWGGL
jgi:hypothetical protein